MCIGEPFTSAASLATLHGLHQRPGSDKDVITVAAGGTQHVRFVADLAQFNRELGRRLASLDRGETVRPAAARARLQRKSADRRKPRV